MTPSPSKSRQTDEPRSKSVKPKLKNKKQSMLQYEKNNNKAEKSQVAIKTENAMPSNKSDIYPDKHTLLEYLVDINSQDIKFMPNDKLLAIISSWQYISGEVIDDLSLVPREDIKKRVENILTASLQYDQNVVDFPAVIKRIILPVPIDTRFSTWTRG